jgi:hypothetical protein
MEPVSVASEMPRVRGYLEDMSPEAQVRFMLDAGLTTQAQADKAISRIRDAEKTKRLKGKS